MVGGAFPPGLVTVKVSVRHWVRVVAEVVVPAARSPLDRLTAVVVATTGPVMPKEMKSRRS